MIHNFINKEEKNMEKRIIAVMLVFLMILGTCEITANAASYATGTYSVSTRGGINVRTGAGSKYSKVGGAANGTTFQVTKVNGSWGYTSSIRCTNGTKAGWVSLNYCKKVDSVRNTYNDVFASVRGSGYSLFQARELESTSFTKGTFVYVWAFVHDAENNFYKSYGSGTCNMTLSVYRPNGSCAGTYTYNDSDNNWIGLKLDEVGTWKIQSKITGSIRGTNTRTITVEENSITSSDLGKSSLQAKFEESVYNIATAQVGKNYSTYANKGIAWCGYYIKWVLKNAYEQIGYNYKNYIPVSKLTSASMTGAAYQTGQYGECYSFTSWKKTKTGCKGFISENRNNCLPKAGDIILVETNGKLSDGPDHLGIIIKVNSDGSFVASEGNTGSGTVATRVVREYTYVKSGGSWQRKSNSSCKVHMICSVKVPN